MSNVKYLNDDMKNKFKESMILEGEFDNYIDGIHENVNVKIGYDNLENLDGVLNICAFKIDENNNEEYKFNIVLSKEDVIKMIKNIEKI